MNLDLYLLKMILFRSAKLKNFITSSTEPGDCLNKYLVEQIFIIAFPFITTEGTHL